MQTNQQWDYIAPEIEMQVIKVEQGFSLSDPNSEPMPEIGEDEVLLVEKFIKKYQWIEAQLKENRLHIQTTASLFHNDIKLDGLQVQINMSGGIQLNISSLDKFNSTSELYNAIQNCDICSQTREYILVNFNDDTQACAKIIFSLAKLRESTFDSINTKYIIETDINTYIAQYYKIRFDSNVNYIDKDLNDNNLITHLQYLRKRYPKRSFPSANQNQSKPKINIDWRKIIFVPIFILAAICCAVIFCETSEIHYTTSDNQKLVLDSYKFENKILRHRYKDGKGVITFKGELTYIPKEAFKFAPLTSITLPESVSSICKNAFHCSELESIYIPGSLAVIEAEAFLGCHKLRYIELPEGLKTIDSWAFQGCSSLNKITIPKNVEVIGDRAFYWCGSLESVVIENGTTEIGSEAFGECVNLRTVSIPKSVRTIGKRAFYKCSCLESVTIEEGLINIDVESFTECSNLRSISIPNTVSSIGERAFAGCKSLTTFNFGRGLKHIGNLVFEGCQNLVNVHIPSGVIVWRCKLCGKGYNVTDSVYYEYGGYYVHSNIHPNSQWCAECCRDRREESDRDFWRESIKEARNKWVDDNPWEAQQRGIHKF